MGRCIGLDVHRDFAQVAIWEKGRVRDADQLAPRPGRIRQRTEQVEDRAHRELAAHRDDVARRLVMRRREHEAEASLVDAAPDGLGAEIDARAERLE